MRLLAIMIGFIALSESASASDYVQRYHCGGQKWLQLNWDRRVMDVFGVEYNGLHADESEQAIGAYGSWAASRKGLVARFSINNAGNGPLILQLPNGRTKKFECELAPQRNR